MPQWIATLVDLGFSLTLIAVGVVFGVLALNMLITSMRMWLLAQASRKWPAAEGKVIDAQIRIAGVRSPSSRPVVRYSYAVEGAGHVGSRINFEGAQTYTREEAEQIIARYPAGSAVLVYYDPTRPLESTLERRHVGVAAGIFLGLLVLVTPSALCLIPGLTFFIETFTKNR